VRGIVRAPYADGTISIEHEPIPNFMPAMTMPFYADQAEAGNLKPGDRVEFEFRVGERSRATKFRPLGRAPEVPPRETGAVAPAVSRRRLREGDAVPPFTLVDQDGRTMTEGDLRGHATVMTFIFTRCPVPEFCPLMAKKFQSLQSTLANGSDKVRLLSISIDPEHDVPAVLREYGQSLGADFGRWRFATGSAAEVQALTKLFAVRTERNSGSLDHTLATALIGPDGTVTEIWRGNAWKPEEVLAKIQSPRP
jgi:protein SCO1/2